MNFSEQALAFFDSVVDCAHVEECLFGVFVDFAVENHLESAYCFAQRHKDAFEAGELFGHVEGLREETLGATGAVYHELVVVGEFVNTKNGNDVLKLVVFLQ